jgi:hypothetical protein
MITNISCSCASEITRENGCTNGYILRWQLRQYVQARSHLFHEVRFARAPTPSLATFATKLPSIATNGSDQSMGHV